MKLDLSNDATKSDLKKATCVDTSQFAKKDDLANLKSEVDKLDINKLSELDADTLKIIPVDLSKLSDVVQNYVVTLTLFRMGIFEAAHELGRGAKRSPSLKSVTHIVQ